MGDTSPDPMAPPPLPPAAQDPQGAATVPPVVLREPNAPPPEAVPAPQGTQPRVTEPRAAVPLAPPPEQEPDAIWRGIIGQGEEILWEGRDRLNDSGRDRPRTPATRRGGLLGPLIMIVFALFWMGIASRGGGIIWLFGLIFLYKGGRNLMTALQPAPGNAAIDAAVDPAHPAPRYLLTNRAAYILRGAHAAERVAISKGMRITLQKGRAPSVYFADATHGKQRGYLKNERLRGFENIDDAAEVYAMMRGLAREMR